MDVIKDASILNERLIEFNSVRGPSVDDVWWTATDIATKIVSNRYPTPQQALSSLTGMLVKKARENG